MRRHFAVLIQLLGAALAAKTTPEQVHLAFAGQDSTGASTGMRVAWFTQDQTSAKSTVKYGTKSGSLTEMVSSDLPPVEYLKSYGYHHVVEVVDLTPNTQFYYAVGSDADGWSDEWSFKTAPSGSDASKAEITVSVYGDMGYEDSSQRPMEVAVAGLVKKWSATVSRDRLMALKDELDFAWHVGDIGYADDAFAHSLLGFTYEDCYSGFMNWIQDFAATKPYMVSVGNHESECHSPSCLVDGKKRKALSNFTAYNSRFHMPSSESVRQGSTHSMWHSWNYGPVHFISVNTETDFPNAEERDKGDSGLMPAGHFGADGEYLQWLESDLKAAAAARASGNGPRWIVAGGHRPYGDIKAEHVPLFEKYGVDLYLAGHGHSYSRGAPVQGTTYVMVGGAGCDEMNYVEAENDDMCVAAGSPQACDPGYAVPHGTEEFRTSQIAIGVLKANATALNWRLVDSISGSTLDEITITAPNAVIV